MNIILGCAKDIGLMEKIFNLLENKDEYIEYVVEAVKKSFDNLAQITIIH